MNKAITSTIAMPDLSGEWIGYYPGHFDEVISITYKGNLLIARKITGDDYVPAGQITWQANLDTGEVQGQISELEFVNPRFVPARLIVISPDRIVVQWLGLGNGEVEFRKDADFQKEV